MLSRLEFLHMLINKPISYRAALFSLKSNTNSPKTRISYLLNHRHLSQNIEPHNIQLHDDNISNDSIIKDVSNKIIACNKLTHSIYPIFAIIYLYGEQYKITNYDIIRCHGFLPAQMGEVIKLDKVLVMGGKDFSLFGRPFLPSDMINITATVIERGLTHMYTDFRHWKKPFSKSRMRITRYNRTVLRINNLSLNYTPEQMAAQENYLNE
ncbi:unnamed protein product [Gordionus sp. m RMFG-2023]|uniref:large ribosomal subunit protein bL21m-like n=1 Tax=Gordionus sp. m RMFG-2023 TaxID=3053472 RepID=UPI0030E50493